MDFIPHTEDELKEMLSTIGVVSVEALFASIPKNIRIQGLGLPPGIPEHKLKKELMELSRKNATTDDYKLFRGAGAYEHFIPSVVDHLLSRSEFYTAYTPYQPEASQGTLQTIYEYQTMMCELMKMDISNASLYDGASALAEAALVALRCFDDRNEIIIPQAVHPEYREVVHTYLRHLDVTISETEFTTELVTDAAAVKNTISSKTAAVVVQSPNFFGCIEAMDKLSELAHQHGALFIACVNPLSLGVLKPPGEYGADIAVGEGQPLGIPLSFGGPYLGIFTCKENLLRKMPGRIVGRTKDAAGNPGFVLTLQAREQHIRREKATSNICTNQALMALAACIYLALLGKKGMREVAELNIQKSHYAREQLSKINGLESASDAPFFNEFVLKSRIDSGVVNEKLLEKKIIGGLELKRFYPEMADCLLFCVTETRTKEDIDGLGEELISILDA